MSKLIDAEKLDFVSYQGIPDGYKDSFDSGVLYAMNLIDDQPTIDAVTVKHGCWALRENNNYVEPDGVCSNCGAAWVFSDTHYFNYCPHCGAIMDSDEVTE